MAKASGTARSSVRSSRYSVKRYTKGQEILRLGTKGGGEIVYQTSRQVSWHVVDENGKPITSINPVTRKLQFDAFNLKSAAVAQADYLNKRKRKR